MSKHYDVVVIGAGLGALAAAALLSRRSWRVLLIGHGRKASRYEWEGLTFARRAHTFVAGASPAWRRIAAELAQTQTLKRKMHQRDPMVQLITPSYVLDIPPDAARFSLELAREFPEQRRTIEEFYTELARITAQGDEALDHELVLPPGTFWEKREVNRVFSKVPFVEEGSAPPPLFSLLPREFVEVIRATVAFSTSLSGANPAFAQLRLHASYTRGISDFQGGEEELNEFLVERIRAQGGDVQLNDKVESIEVRKGAIVALKTVGGDARIGAGFVVSDLTEAQLLSLARFEGRAGVRVGVVGAEQRFVVSAVVRKAGIPQPLARESFLMPPRESNLPLVRLSREPLDESCDLLTLESLEVERQRPLSKLRDSVMLTLMHFFPFMSGHFIAVDSVYDGLPLWDYRSGSRADVERASVRSGPTPAEPEPMEQRFRVNGSSFFGLGAESVRSELGGAFHVGRSVLPALGQEGELLAALGVARIINRTDSQKEKMRRDMWSKIELS